jgi:hypothetical protein
MQLPRPAKQNAVSSTYAGFVRQPPRRERHHCLAARGEIHSEPQRAVPMKGDGVYEMRRQLVDHCRSSDLLELALTHPDDGAPSRNDD